jgi:hypothetical protein
MKDLFEEQLKKLKRHHFLILYWAAEAEVNGVRYNITNVFDDLKMAGITRTKQSAVSYVETLDALCLITVKEESNRKNIYLSSYGETALEKLVTEKSFEILKSNYLGGKK